MRDGIGLNRPTYWLGFAGLASLLRDVERLASVPSNARQGRIGQTREWSSCGLLVGLVAYENRTMTTITPTMAADSYTT